MTPTAPRLAGPRAERFAKLTPDRLLSFAAAPVFAVMAVITLVHGQATPGILCSPDHSTPMSEMAVMYLLMAAFHSAPWLRSIGGRSGVSPGIAPDG